LFLTSPNAIGLPAVERGATQVPVTRALISEQWPRIERLLADGRVEEAISSMEALAMQMRGATGGDGLLFRDALILARRVLYDDLAEVARAAGCEASARAALDRSIAWDEELRPYLKELVARGCYSERESAT
jgi:hypothetical protein